MKKIFCLLFALCLMAAALAISASADDGMTVVYLETGASGDGSTADRPVGSLGKAVELLDKTKDCTIVVCGKFSQTGTFAYPEEISGSITITSSYDGEDYRRHGAAYECVGARFVCSGEYIFKDIDIRLTGDSPDNGKYMFVIANHNPFTIGEGVTIESTHKDFDGLSFGSAFSILGGYQSGQPELRGVKDPPPAESEEEVNITVLSGSGICIGAYSRQIDGAYYMGKANITIGGTADVKRVFLTPANKPFTCGTVALTVKDNAKVGEIYGSTSTGFAEGFELNWLGGSISKYDDKFSASNNVLFDNGKKLVYAEAVKSDANFEAVSASFDKVLKEGESEVAEVTTVVKMTIGQMTAYINDTATALDAAPVIRSDRTMLPVRFVAEAFGATVGWDGATSTATVTGEGISIVITVGKAEATVNGEVVKLDSPAYIDSSNNRTYMPVRFVAESLGASVAWDGATSTATLTKTGTASAAPVNPDNTTADGIKLYTIAELNTEAPSADSHEGLSASSSVELNFREYTEVSPMTLLTSEAIYPRVKVMANGEYIMFWQNAQIGTYIYYSTSRDLINWERGEVLFRTRAVTNFEGAQDSVRYSTCDAVVLSNGDILAVCSYRYNLGYTKDASQGGLAVRRSSDNGKSWSEEQTIYVGVNWEPYITEHNGEVKIFFTHNAPKFYLDGKLDKDYLSSGVGMLTSKDMGKTWTPNVTEAPYSADIVMQQQRKVDAAKTLYTDQMPSVAYLNNGTSVMAVESRPDGGELYISLGYSTDGWSSTLGIEEVGPAKRADNIFEGAAPYILQFDSGETLLSYNVNNRFSLRIGDTNGENFGASVIPFDKAGYWGTIEKRSSHSAIAAIANTSGTNSMMVGTVYLNHAINASNSKITLDGDNADWAGVSEALFVGSETQAQAAIRASVADGKLYLLFERADYSLTSGDSITLYLSEEGMDGFLRVRISEGGVTEFVRSGETLEKMSSSEIGYAAKNLGTVDKPSDKDIGKIIEISVPLVRFSTDKIRINATLYNQDASESKVSDSMGNLTLTDTAAWPVIVRKF